MGWGVPGILVISLGRFERAIPPSDTQLPSVCDETSDSGIHAQPASEYAVAQRQYHTSQGYQPLVIGEQGTRAGGRFVTWGRGARLPGQHVAIGGDGLDIPSDGRPGKPGYREWSPGRDGPQGEHAIARVEGLRGPLMKTTDHDIRAIPFAMSAPPPDWPAEKSVQRYPPASTFPVATVEKKTKESAKAPALREH